MTERKLLLAVLGGLMACGAAACYSVSVGPAGYERHGVWLPKKGGTPHRGADRITVGGLDMVFDDELGVYRVVDHPGVYYNGVRYYRQDESDWEAAPAFSGPWAGIPRIELPPGLAQIEVSIIE
jgi:hypothetical protein